jgi:hypothetical protein
MSPKPKFKTKDDGFKLLFERRFSRNERLGKIGKLGPSRRISVPSANNGATNAAARLRYGKRRGDKRRVGQAAS